MPTATVLRLEAVATQTGEKRETERMIPNHPQCKHILPPSPPLPFSLSLSPSRGRLSDKQAGRGRLPVVLSGEAVVSGVLGGVVECGRRRCGVAVGLQGALSLLRPVGQRGGVHLLDVTLDGAHLEGGQRGAAHHADEAVPPAVVVHQILGAPARLVVATLVLARVVAVVPTRGGGPCRRRAAGRGAVFG